MIGFARLSPISRARAPEGGRRAGGSVRVLAARSIAAAAYRHGLALRDDAGTLADYTRRQPPEAHGLTARDPGGALTGWTQTGRLSRDQAAEIGALWNAVEASEKRRDSRLAVDWVVALPHEAPPEARAAMAQQMAEALTRRHGVAVAWAIHRPDPGKGDRNVHVHLMASARQAARGEDGWTMGAKAVALDQRKGLAAFKADAAAILDDWAAAAGISNESRAWARASLRGYKAADRDAPEGLRRTGTQHLGPALAAMERAGEATAKGDANRARAAANRAAMAARAAHAQADAAAARVAQRLRTPGPQAEPRPQATPHQDPGHQTRPETPRPQATHENQRPDPGPRPQAAPPEPPPTRDPGPEQPRPQGRTRPDLPPIRDLPAYLAWTIRMECRGTDADRARAQAGRIRALAWAVETLGPTDGARAYRAAYDAAMARLGFKAGPEADRLRTPRDAVLRGAIAESGATAARPEPLTAWAGGVLDRAAEIHRRQPLDAFTPWGWANSIARTPSLPGKSRTEREIERGAARLAALLRMWQEQAAQQDAPRDPGPWGGDEHRRAAEAAAWARVWRFAHRARDGPTL